MSRFADPKATGRFVLSHREPLTPKEIKAGITLESKPWVPDPCGCEGQPHAEDWIEVRTEISTADWEALPAFSGAALLRRLAVSWNLTENGEAAPLDESHLDRLFVDIFEAFDAWAAKNIRWGPPLPNASAAPSPDSLPGSGSPTLRATTAGSSMTPSWPPAAPTATSETPPLSS